MLPYIGVTDFVGKEQVLQLLPSVHLNRRLHVGVMSSYKQLQGMPTKWADIWPDQTQLQSIFSVVDPRVYNVIHYADFEVVAPTTIDVLTFAIDRCGPNVHAIQLDMIWPNPDLVRELKVRRPHIDIILQVSATAMEIVDDWERELSYYTDIRYVLLDNGMGRGTQFDPTAFLRKIEAVERQGYDQDQIVVAGGLGPLTYKNLEPILDRYDRISCDAQSRLRPEQDAMKALDIVYAMAYIEGVSKLIEAN